MNKKKKLSLKDIEVESFVTSLENKEKATIDGGASIMGVCIRSIGNACNWGPIQIEETVICIPNSHDQGGCTLIICTDPDDAVIPVEPQRTDCSAFNRGSCHGTLG